MLSDDRASRAMGIEVLAVGDGAARARMRITADMANGHAIAHGAFVFALADTTFACACNSLGPASVAAAAEIVFVAPAQVGDELTAEAQVRAQFGRTGIYDVTVRRGDDVIAEFRGRSQQVADRNSPRATSE
jgi:acyl-CoA thioesterase